MIFKQILMKLSLLAVNAAAFGTAASGGPYKKIPDGDTGTIIKFYLNWASYLHRGYGYEHSIAGFIMTPIIQTLFTIDRGLENIYNVVFKLLGWEGNVASYGSPLHALYVFFQAAGWSLLALGVIIYAYQSLTHQAKWGQFASNLIMVSLTMTALPLMMQMFNNAAVQAENGLNSVQTKEMAADVAIQPIKNNTIDLSTLIRANNFNDFSDKPESKKIRNVAKWNVISTSKDVRQMNLGQYLDKDTMSKDLKLDKYKPGETAMQYHLEDEHNQANGGYIIAKNHAGAGLGGLNDDTYARYSVNWVGVIGQSLVLGVVLLLAGVRVIEDSYELALMDFVAPLIAYRSLRSTKKMRDLISSIVGMYTSIVFMMTLIKIYMISLNILSAKIPSMNWFQRSIVILMIYIGGGFAMFNGLNYLERVTGVSQGLSDQAGQVVATGAIAGAAGGAVASIAGHTLSGVGRATSFFASRGNSNTASRGLNNNTNSTSSFNRGLNDSNSMANNNNNSQLNGQQDKQNQSQEQSRFGTNAQNNNQTNGQNTNNASAISRETGVNGNNGNNGINGNDNNQKPQSGIDGNNGTNGINDVEKSPNGGINDTTQPSQFAQNGDNFDASQTPDGIDQRTGGIDDQNLASLAANEPLTDENGMPFSDSPISDNNENGMPNLPNTDSDATPMTSDGRLDNPDSGNSLANSFDNVDSNESVEPLPDDDNPSDNSFAAQADQLNNPQIPQSNVNTDQATDTRYQEDQMAGSQYGSDARHLDQRVNSDRHVQDQYAPDQQRTNRAYNVGQRLQHTGQRVTRTSKSIRQQSTQYLKNHQFNLSSGNLKGRESDHLD